MILYVDKILIKGNDIYGDDIRGNISMIKQLLVLLITIVNIKNICQLRKIFRLNTNTLFAT